MPEMRVHPCLSRLLKLVQTILRSGRISRLLLCKRSAARAIGELGTEVGPILSGSIGRPIQRATIASLKIHKAHVTGAEEHWQNPLLR